MLKIICYHYYIMKTYVGIYKIPAIWDRLPKEKFLKKDKIDFVLSNNVKEINEHTYRITNTKNNKTVIVIALVGNNYESECS